MSGTVRVKAASRTILHITFFVRQVLMGLVGLRAVYVAVI